MRKYTNQQGLPLAIAVYLATDHYDHEDDTVSATALLKPTRQLILAKRLPEDMSLVDVGRLLKSRMGTSIHDGIEKAWLDNYRVAMTALGYPQRVIDRVVINPDPDTVTEDQIPVYMEQRSYREIMGVKISGKFDFVAEGMIEDFKSTGTFTWVNGVKDEDYILQGSIYRWLNPKIVTSDQMRINFIFWDWQAARVKADPKYPKSDVAAKTYNLLSIEQTEAFIRNKLAEITRYQDADEADLPLCSDKELWRSSPVWKYYKNPQNTTRSTKNFDNPQDAYLRLQQDGHVGKVVEVAGDVVACKYCPAFPLCSQAKALVADGSLKL
jgi:hypothetical protein